MQTIPLEGVTATDEEDGDISGSIEVLNNEVDTTKVGIYEVTYKVTDSQGASTTKTIYVAVTPSNTSNASPHWSREYHLRLSW